MNIAWWHRFSAPTITIATNKAGPAIRTGKTPYAIAITPDGRTAYVANLVWVQLV